MAGLFFLLTGDFLCMEDEWSLDLESDFSFDLEIDLLDFSMLNLVFCLCSSLWLSYGSLVL